ncbi:MAG: adenylate/guanylate cyclase domain-containing protein [Gammaproteobacteria bacterium]|nr:adenylate/guanylate cyclase domain-containing protein [Gammaproteobacteria bacterium]MBT3472767.1 adenylate/guanylate cyclase domain-containing protein [Gammaproteobacteria bacterium]MBT4329841.1 adenylate/guanylate cyclase domain-containing protein [Gammaproteobacteria bacterium]MBT8007057.1 adenylate/guanylate cyclase domain-containing protein [Gammaproteobacteria bacterium]
MKKVLGRYDILITIALFLAMIPAEYNESFAMLEEQTLSARQILRMSYGDQEQTSFSKDEIVILNMDESFFDEYRSFPLRRTDIATMASALHNLGAKVIALDVLLDFPSSYGEDEAAAKLLKETGSSMLVSQAKINADDVATGMNYPTEAYRGSAKSGYTNITSSSSIITSLSKLRIREDTIEMEDGWPFAVQALAMYYEAEPAFIEEDGQKYLTIGELRVPLDHHNQFHIDFPALTTGATFLNQTDASISAMEVLRPYLPYLFEGEEDPEEAQEEALEELEDLSFLFEGKIVVIGDTSEVSHDWFDTPVGMVYGVEIIADAIHTMMRGTPLQPATQNQEFVVLMAVMIVMVMISFISTPSISFVLTALLVTGYSYTVGKLYIDQGLVFSMSYVLTAAFLSYLVINLRHYLQERDQKGFVTAAFGQYLSPDVVDALVKDPSKMSLGGESREMTAFFSDVASFSTISEKLTPGELVGLLNEYLTAMCDIIAESGGTIDKFEGDAIIGFWGAPLEQPDHAVRACYSIIDQQKFLVPFRQEQIDKGWLPVEFTVRMGVNTGMMIVGNMGSSQRMDYTMMGDAVNLAARLEGANKFYKNHQMISQSTYEQAKDFIDTRELDTIRVVGKNEPVTVYDVIDRKNQTSGVMADVVPIYLQGLQKYKELDFVGAQQLFRKALTVLETDGPSITYVDRCQHFIDNPPADDWDRVWTHTEKG